MDRDGRMLASLYENMVGGLITQAEFVRMKAEYEAKIQGLAQKADEIRNRQSALKSRATETTDLADAVSEAVRNDALTADIIERLVLDIRVRPNKSFHVRFRFQDEFGEVPCVG
jgi:hypothetical protein